MLFTAALVFTWYFAATLLLIFAGMLLGVGLNALTNALGRRVHLPHAARLAIVCIVLAILLMGVAYLRGATIAEQAAVLSKMAEAGRLRSSARSRCAQPPGMRQNTGRRARAIP